MLKAWYVYVYTQIYLHGPVYYIFVSLRIIELILIYMTTYLNSDIFESSFNFSQSLKPSWVSSAFFIVLV